MAKGNIYVKDLETHEVVHTILFEGGPRKLEKVEMGLMRQMDLDRFFADASEIESQFTEET